jgi:hypothetical protein
VVATASRSAIPCVEAIRAVIEARGRVWSILLDGHFFLALWLQLTATADNGSVATGFRRT